MLKVVQRMQILTAVKAQGPPNWSKNEYFDIYQALNTVKRAKNENYDSCQTSKTTLLVQKLIF